MGYRGREIVGGGGERGGGGESHERQEAERESKEEGGVRRRIGGRGNDLGIAFWNVAGLWNTDKDFLKGLER